MTLFLSSGLSPPSPSRSFSALPVNLKVKIIIWCLTRCQEKMEKGSLWNGCPPSRNAGIILECCEMSNGQADVFYHLSSCCFNDVIGVLSLVREPSHSVSAGSNLLPSFCIYGRRLERSDVISIKIFRSAGENQPGNIDSDFNPALVQTLNLNRGLINPPSPSVFGLNRHSGSTFRRNHAEPITIH